MNVVLNLEQLTYVVEVDKVKSLSEAALRLHVSQSAISQAITALEKELGLKLFNRSRSGTTSTEEGQLFIKKAFEATKIIQEMLLESENRKHALSGLLRLGTMPAEMATLVNVIVSLKKEHPEVHIEITEQGSLKTLQLVRQGKIDLGMIALPEDLLQQEALPFDTLYQGKMMVVAGRNSPLASQKSIPPEEMRAYSFVLYKDDYIDMFIRDFTEQFGEVNILFKTNSDSAIQSAILEGLAISIGHDYSFQKATMERGQSVHLLEIERFAQQPVHFGWIRSANSSRSAINEYFIQRYKLEARFGNTENRY
ncbi:DNA-binding transcriptional LysR family regulator [Paenibacillus sp. RC62]